MFINVEGILAKIAKMAKEYSGNIPEIFSAVWARLLTHAPLYFDDLIAHI